MNAVKTLAKKKKIMLCLSIRKQIVIIIDIPSGNPISIYFAAFCTTL